MILVFCDKWTNLQCITTTTFSIIVNGKPSNIFMSTQEQSGIGIKLANDSQETSSLCLQMIVIFVEHPRRL